MNTARADDPPDDDVDALKAMIVALRAENWRFITEKAARDVPPEVWLPLMAASIDVWGADRSERQRKSDYENVRKWCELGTIVAEKRGGRLFVRMDNLRAHVAALRAK